MNRKNKENQILAKISSILYWPFVITAFFIFILKNPLGISLRNKNPLEETSPRKEITAVEDQTERKSADAHKILSSETVHDEIHAHLGDMSVDAPPVTLEGYDELLEDTLYKFKEKSEKDIWRHTFEHLDWFVDEFYNHRANEVFMKEKIGTYLIPSEEALSQYKESLVFDVIYLLEQTLNTSAQGAPSPLNAEDLKRVLDELIPTQQEMTDSVYAKMEAKGQNKIYISREMELWKAYQLQHPNTTLAYDMFALALVVILNAPALSVFTVGAIILTNRGLAYKHQKDKDVYKNELRAELFKKKAIFDGQVKFFIEQVFEGMKRYTERRGRPAQLNLQR